MVKSMTGYGRYTTQIDQSKWTVEIKSVNHRFLDFSPKIPRSLLFMEDALKKTLMKYMKRGRVDLFIYQENESPQEKKLQVDHHLVKQYIGQLEELKEEHQLTGDITIDMVTRLENVFTVTETSQVDSELEEKLLDAVDRAAEELASMRKTEGRHLKNDVLNRLTRVKTMVDKIDAAKEELITLHREKILTRLKDHLKDYVQEEDSRLIQEAAILAEKGNITEEVIRLYSHIEQFKAGLSKEDSIGRHLDFIVQEFHREINTIGSKSNDAVLSNHVVQLKSEVEKIKEQVQNIE
ncbi:YicC/YloC family endoribonuclease [Halobacillus sp. Marseille-Q1614]|uniref:YicC/YloC family endoribonuclease n=1 Tax=Halobacillus sp. Marseille-Q1614 TaxID=2709134 RepID=UPI00156E2693|nr:YicC/YloC family endoribonuclease [Halobacillus sp. Marseille-Q1614]